MGVSADNRAKIKTFKGGIPTADRVSMRRSMALRASGGRRTNASTFFLDLPALITISILQQFETQIRSTKTIYSKHFTVLSHTHLCACPKLAPCNPGDVTKPEVKF